MILTRFLVATIWLGLVTAVAADPVAPLSARFAEPTDRYPHNVLGDLPGFAALEVSLPDGRTLRLVQPETRVFEDIAPRLWDVDGDGIAEIVAVQSDQALGARLTAWTVQRATDGETDLSLRAAGEFIGTRFRWLAPAGIADFTGDGRPEIAYVEMPHLARRLVLVGLDGDRFVPIARLEGVSNHRIGENFITGGVRDCGAGPELLLPVADRSSIARITFANGRLKVEEQWPWAGAEALDARLACR
jgi:hypothetical protein